MIDKIKQAWIEQQEHTRQFIITVVAAILTILVLTVVTKLFSVTFVRPALVKEATAETYAPEPTRLERAVAAEMERIRQAGEPMPSPEDIVMRAIAGVTAEEEQRGSN